MFEAIYSDLIFGDINKKNWINIHNFEIWSDFEKIIFENYLENKKKYMDDISALLKTGWTIERLNLPLLAILLEAISEYHSLKTDYKVLIQQSVVTTKKYCDDDEYKFLNSLLDNYLKNIKQC